MKIKEIICVLMFVWLIQIGAVFGQETLTVFDSRKNSTGEKTPPAIANLVRRAALSKLKKLISSDNCAPQFEVTGTAQGAFTRKLAQQTAVLYEYCQYANGFAYNGIAIVENQKIILHYFFNGSWLMSFKSLPDINQNGLNEMLIEASGGMHQGFYGTGIDILEISQNRIKGIGSAQTSSNECEEGESGEECPREYKIFAKPGKTPVFFRERYNLIDSEKLVKVGQRKIFSLTRSNEKYEIIK
jgi:hypothetical protein